MRTTTTTTITTFGTVEMPFAIHLRTVSWADGWRMIVMEDETGAHEIRIGHHDETSRVVILGHGMDEAVRLTIGPMLASAAIVQNVADLFGHQVLLDDLAELFDV